MPSVSIPAKVGSIRYSFPQEKDTISILFHITCCQDLMTLSSGLYPCVKHHRGKAAFSRQRQTETGKHKKQGHAYAARATPLCALAPTFVSVDALHCDLPRYNPT